jgi:hypothetical protein
MLCELFHGAQPSHCDPSSSALSKIHIQKRRSAYPLPCLDKLDQPPGAKIFCKLDFRSG